MGEFGLSFFSIGNKNQNKPVNQPSETVKSSTVNLFDNEPEKTPSKKEVKKNEKEEKKRINNTPDGIIQGGKQGSNAGDCWLLAEMNSMAQTDWGKEAFKNAITTNENGDYEVSFKGIDKTVTITQKEFKRAQGDSDYSSGDADALLYELAVERHFKEADLNNETIYGNQVAGEASLQYLMTGSKGRETKEEAHIEPILKEMGKSPENNNGIAATYVYNAEYDGSKGRGHVVSIQQVILDDKENVDKIVIKDSYHPERTQTISFKSFKRSVTSFGYVTRPKQNTTPTPPQTTTPTTNQE